MPSDDILDLIGRYATGSLTAEEQKRLFDAALDDQDLFEQLVREQDMKQLLDEPGVRDRMIRALEPPPRRRTAWIYGIAATVAMSVALVVFLLRPAPKPPQVAMEKSPATPAAVTPTEAPPPETKPAEPPPRDAAPPELRKAEPPPERREVKAKATAGKQELPAGQPSLDSVVSPVKDAGKKETDQVQVAAAAPPPVAAPQRAAVPQKAIEASQVRAQQAATQQQRSPGGPRQMTQQSGLASPTSIGGFYDAKGALPFGFHYSLEIEGHLSIIPAADGYLFAKTSDGTVLFGPKLSAAGIIVDLPLTDAVSSVVITFSENANPVQTKPAVRAEPTGTVQGSVGGVRALAVEVKVKP
jgi:hypothetical protein